MLEILGNVAVLIVGSLVLSLIGEGVQQPEEHSFSLPMVNIFLVTLVGGILSYWFSWRSTGTVLGVYGLWCVLSGLAARRAEKH